MKFKKYLAFLGALALLASCNQDGLGEYIPGTCAEDFSYASLEGRARKDTYTTFLTYMPSTLNYTKTMQAENAQHIANFVDGLVENDRFGNLVPCLATNTGVPNSDYSEWTFTINSTKASKWVDKNGNEWTGNGRTSSLVTAEDFKSTLKLVLNASTASESAYLPMLIIEGAEQYNVATSLRNTYGENNLGTVLTQLKLAKSSTSGEALIDSNATVDDLQEILDFKRVGVEVDPVANTIKYKLIQGADYFPTMLTYLPFLPICMEYYESVGSDFGSESNILFNGAYLLNERTDMKISYKKNPTYWEADKVKTKNVVYDLLQSTIGNDFARTQYELGNIDSFGVNSLDEEGWKKYVLGPDEQGTILDPHNDLTYSQESTSVDSTFFFYLNMNRPTTTPGGLTVLTASDITNSNNAFKYSYIRDAIFSGFDIAAYNARNGSEPIEQQQMQMNTYIPRNFVTDNNGKDYFEYLVDAYVAKHEGATKEDAESVLAPGQVHQISDEEAKKKVDEAVAQLQKDEPTIKLPIKVEYTTLYTDDETRYFDDLFVEFTNRRLNGCYRDESIPHDGLKVCGTGDEKIVLQINTKVTTSQNYITIANDSSNPYSLFVSGWGPDYGDPMTYAHTLIIGGDMSAHLGIQTEKGLSEETITKLRTYENMVNLAQGKVSISQELKAERYKAFAEAELYMLEECAIIKPLYQPGQGVSCTVSKFIPYRTPRAGYGLSNDKLKGLEILTEPLTSCERQRLRTEWLQDKEREGQN